MRKLLTFTAVLMVAMSATAVAMTLDEALGLFVNSDINIPYSDEGQAQLEEMIAAFKEALGVTDVEDEPAPLEDDLEPEPEPHPLGGEIPLPATAPAE